MKRCTKCGNDLPVSAFAKDKSKQDGLYPSCRDCRRLYYGEHREARLAYNRRWYAENSTVGKALTREWMRRNAERHSQRRLAWKHRNRDHIREYRRSRGSSDVHRRRAKILGNGGSYTQAEWKALCEAFGNRCLACGATSALTVDHVIPVDAGGSNYIDNLQPLCGICNSAKGTKTIDYRLDYCPCA